MDKETELIKIQAFIEQSNSTYTAISSYLASSLIAIIAIYVSLVGVFKDLIPIWTILVMIPLATIFVGLALYVLALRHRRELRFADHLMEKVENGEPLPTIEKLMKLIE